MTSLVPALKNGLRSLVAIRQLNLSRKAALLTFDDGPHPEVTQKVLNLLRKYSARAVFFVVGSRIPCAPHLLQEILAEGHIIGNHTFHHRARGLSYVACLQDTRQCQSEVLRLTGFAPTLFRPAEGVITPANLLACRRLRMRTILWSYDTNDWRLSSDAEVREQTERALGALATGARNPIILMHDDNRYSPGLLEPLLESSRAGATISKRAQGRWIHGRAYKPEFRSSAFCFLVDI
jgi:peptidoglycan/xylan/chitin deacetylase (PgdA/CDA1 family)